MSSIVSRKERHDIEIALNTVCRNPEKPGLFAKQEHFKDIADPMRHRDDICLYGTRRQFPPRTPDHVKHVEHFSTTVRALKIEWQQRPGIAAKLCCQQFDLLVFV